MSVAEDYRLKGTTDEASLTIDGAEHRLPLLKGTLGPDVVDITSLYQDSGTFTYDPGFTSTASCESKITYIDGDKGILLYRGYPIDQLAEHCTFLETTYLLLYGELPNAEQYKTFKQRMTRHTMVHEQMNRFFTGFRRDAHPMAIMVGVVGALSAFYHDSIDIRDPKQRDMASVRMISKMPTIAAISITRRTSSECASQCPARSIRLIRCWRVRCGGFLFSMPTTNRMRPRRRCAWRARRGPIHSLVSRQALPACGARLMAVPTKRR